jgi:hypothetical protein
MRLERQAIGQGEVGKVIRTTHMHLRIVVMQLPGMHAHPLMYFDRTVTHAKVRPSNNIEVSTDPALRHRKNNEKRFGPSVVSRIPFVEFVVISGNHLRFPFKLEPFMCQPERKPFRLADVKSGSVLPPGKCVARRE